MGGFGIGLTEFGIIGLLPEIAAGAAVTAAGLLVLVAGSVRPQRGMAASVADASVTCRT